MIVVFFIRFAEETTLIGMYANVWEATSEQVQ